MSRNICTMIGVLSIMLGVASSYTMQKKWCANEWNARSESDLQAMNDAIEKIAHSHEYENYRTEIKQVFKKFFTLSGDLQYYILVYASTSKHSYALRHKRELAPIMVDGGGVIGKHRFFDSTHIAQFRKGCAEYLQGNPTLKQGAFRAVMQQTFLDPATEVRVVENPSYRSSALYYYSDNTYSIEFNRDQFKKLVDKHTLKQLHFFVDIASLARPHEISWGYTLCTASLSKEQSVIFQSLSFAMQQRLKYIYPWVYFESPLRATYSALKTAASIVIQNNPDIRGIDERVQLASDVCLALIKKAIALGSQARYKIPLAWLA